MDSITLTPSEIYFAKQIAHKRIKHNNKTGTCNTPYGKTLEQVYEVGTIGEVGFCKLYNICPSLEFDNYCGSGFDAYLHGRRIEVKTQDREDGFVAVKDIPKLDNPPDYFALMIISDLPKVAIAGFISASSILNPWHYVNHKNVYHPYYRAYQNELIDVLPDLTFTTTQTEGCERAAPRPDGSGALRASGKCPDRPGRLKADRPRVGRASRSRC